MTPERWAAVVALFEEASRRPHGERGAFLTEACPDPELRAEVESLLANAGDDDPLASMVAAAAASALGRGTGAPGPAASGGDAELVGTRLGPFSIEALCGRGGMGVVFRAVDDRLGRTVALKLLPVELGADEDRRRRFVREARVAATLNHPNIATVYEAGEVAGRAFLAMEYVDGETLRHRLAGGALPVADAIAIGRQILAGLASAHAATIAHRDLKPENVMLTGAGVVKLLDFGLAADTAAPAETATVDRVIGTPRYMAPEQASGAVTRDVRVDVWAFGVTLYEMLVGEPPFVGASALETLDRIQRTEPVPPRRRVPRLAMDLDAIVMTCLEREPAARYATAKAIAEDLERYVAHVPIAARRASRLYRARVYLRRHRRTAIAAALVPALVAVGALGARRARRSSWQPVVRERQPTFDENSTVADPSPDGTLLAYDSDRAHRGGVSGLYVEPAAGGAARLVTPEDLDVHMPAFSHDGQSVLFIARSGPEGRGVAAGAVRLADGRVTELVRDADLVAPCGDRLLYAIRNVAGCPRCFSLVLRDPDGRDRERLHTTAAEAVTWLRCDRAGHQLVYVTVPEAAGPRPASRVWLADVAGGAPRLIDEETAANPRPTFHPDGKSVVIASNRAGPTNVWELPLAGGAPAQLTFGGGPDTSPAISPDGQRVIFNIDVTTLAVFAHGLDGSVRRITTSLDDVTNLALSPDGTALALEVHRADQTLIVVHELATGEERTLGTGQFPTFAPDGRDVLWTDRTRVLAAPRAGGAARVVAANAPGRVRYLEAGRDGFLYFDQLERDRERGVWRRPIAGGPLVRAAPAPYDVLTPPTPSGWRFAHRADQPFLVELIPPGAEPGGPEVQRLATTIFVPGASGTYVLYGRGGYAWRRDLATGREERLIPLPLQVDAYLTGWPLGEYMLSPDGQTLYVPRFVGAVRRAEIVNYGDRPRP